jgi:hypothetical protein
VVLTPSPHDADHLDFLALRNDDDGNQFADWWADRLPAESWCDPAPVLFDGVSVLRNIGYGVSSSNLADRPLTISESGDILVGSELLRSFHFTKVDSFGEVELDRAANGHSEVFELLRWYRANLSRAAVEGLPKR